MATMEAESVDAVVCDPPYGLSFMGKGWDHGVPGVPFWAEALRVMRPGAHLLAFGGTRTFHRLTCAIEDAGFEIRDSIGYMSACECGCHSPILAWEFGAGFPKSLNPYRSIMAGLCRSHTSAPHAVRLSPSIQAPYGEATDGTVLELALIQPGDVPVLLMGTGAEESSRGLTAIALSALAATTNSNTVSSWSASWAETWLRESRSIIETVGAAITDPRI